MRFQLNDRILCQGEIYRVSGPLVFTGPMCGPAFEIIPVEPVSPGANRSVCGLKVKGLEAHQRLWEKPPGYRGWMVREHCDERA